MTSHEYYGTQPHSPGHDQGHGYNGANHQQGFERHDSNYPPQGPAYGQQAQYQNGYGHSPYPHDQAELAMPSHDSYTQAPQSGYGAPQNASYDQPHDPNLSTSPYPPQNQVGSHHLNQPYMPPQQEGYHDPQKDYGAEQHGQNGVNTQLGVPGEPAEGERGLGSALMGGAGGALVGHKLGGGAMGTLGGMVVGAIGANMLSNEKEKKKKHRKHRKHDSHSSHTGSHSSHSHSHHGSQSSHSHHGSHTHSHHRRHSSHHGSSYNGSSAGLGEGLYVPDHDGHHRHHRSRSRGMSSSSSSGSESE